MVQRFFAQGVSTQVFGLALAASVAVSGAAFAQTSMPDEDQVASIMASELGGAVEASEIEIEALNCVGGAGGADCDFIARFAEGVAYDCDLDGYTVNGDVRPSCDQR